MKKIILLFTVLIGCLQFCYPQAGELDSTFGINGIVKTSSISAISIAVQSDGKTIIANEKLARYNIDGGLDTTFGGGIIQTIGYSGDVAIQPDGKIIVASRRDTGPWNVYVTLSRYNNDGSLDATFDEDGTVNTNLGYSSGEVGKDVSVLIQNDNKIVITSYNGIMRYNTDGSLDNSFPWTGPGFTITAAAIQGDGKIVVVGYDYEIGHTHYDLARFNTDGSLDKSFSEDGIQSTDLGYDEAPGSVAIQSDGKLLVAGIDFHKNKFVLFRYNSDGNLDNTFSGDGMQQIDFGYSIAIESDGKIVTAGPQFALERYNTNGTLDNTFSGDGKQITKMGAGNFFINDIAIANNKLYAGGINDSYPQFGVIARYQLFENTTTTVRISNPYNNQSFTGPATINISAVANAPGGTISKIDFYNGTTLLSSDNTFPYSFVWKDVPVGNYILTAKATDNTGLIVKSPDLHISVVPDKAPVVSITSPSFNNRIYRGPTTVFLSADAADGDPNGTISKVEFYNGSTLIHSDSTSPYTYTWENVPVGEYAITAKATDNTGNATTSSVVNFSMKKNTPSAVTITTPADNTIFTEAATIQIGVAAKDTDDYLAKLYIYSDTTLIQFINVEDGELSYLYNWTNVPVGDYTLTAKVVDNWGLATTSAPVHVKVVPKESAVFITSPLNYQVYGAPAAIPINANVIAEAIDGPLNKVEFYNGSTLLAADDSYPFTYTWNNVATGSYTITAKAIFKNKVFTSDAVHVSVAKNQSPFVKLVREHNVYTAPARIFLRANASDIDGTITQVDFYNGSTLLHTEHVAPYGFLWEDVPVGNYTLTAKATDNSGAVTTSNSIQITVIPNKAPTVSIILPTDSTLYAGPANVFIRVVAQDQDGFIQNVAFYNGNTLLHTEYVIPYGFLWKDIPAGSYTLTAKATDNNGLSAAASVHITVTNNNGSIALSPDVDKSISDLANTSVSFKLNPNPVHNILYVSLNGFRNKTSELYLLSSSGMVIKNIHSIKSSQVSVNVSSLTNGVYFIKVVSGDKVMFKQFVKM